MDVLLKKYQLTSEESILAQRYKKEIFEKNIHKTKVNKLLLYIIENNLFENCIIASNSSRENVDKIMAYHGINQDLFWGILLKASYQKEDYLMVGDSEVDKMFARKLGIKCILVKF